MACTDADFAFLRSVVYEQSSNTLDASRDYLFESRLSPLLNATGLQTLDRLVAVLREQPNAVIRQKIAEAMTVNETSFFRDRAPFDLMQTQLLPALLESRRERRRLRLWSAACSTGQEAYSLAMLLNEFFPQLRDWDVEILGTDLSAEMVARARAGKYIRIEVNRGLPARYLLKYMRRTGEEWEMLPELRQLCRFQQRNLCHDSVPLETFDGILLRNVMLYFSTETRRQLLQNLHRALAPDGFLILGSSEQALLPDLFQPVLASNSCYYRPIKHQRADEYFFTHRARRIQTQSAISSHRAHENQQANKKPPTAE